MDIPGLSMLRGRQLVEDNEDEYTVKITTHAVLQPHEANKLVGLGWSTDDRRTFTYYKQRVIDDVEEEEDENIPF